MKKRTKTVLIGTLIGLPLGYVINAPIGCIRMYSHLEKIAREEGNDIALTAAQKVLDRDIAKECNYFCKPSWYGKKVAARMYLKK